MKQLLPCLVLLAMTLPSPALAETFWVTKQVDENGVCLPDDCALREALAAANSSPGRDIVMIPPGTYRVEIAGSGLGVGSFDITDDLDLIGGPGVELVGDGADRVLAVVTEFGSPAISVTLRELIVSGGASGSNGGGINSSGSALTLVDSFIHDNFASGHGGGVAADLGSLHLVRTTIWNNEAALDGGGVFRIGITNALPSELTITNSSIVGNRAFQGGGVAVRNETLSFRMENCTLSDNEASFRGDALAVVNPNLTAPFVLANNILQASGETATGACSLGLIPDSLGGNLESPGNSCFLPDAADQSGVPDPGLDVLTYGLGPTPVVPLLENSPALDGGVNSACASEDQRGGPRPLDGDADGSALCDAGSFEVAAVADIPVLSTALLWILGIALALGGCFVLRA